MSTATDNYYHDQLHKILEEFRKDDNGIKIVLHCGEVDSNWLNLSLDSIGEVELFLTSVKKLITGQEQGE